MADARLIPSPCRSVCRLGADEVCDGCGRTIAEIVSWVLLEPAEREQVLTRVARWVPREPRSRAQPG